MKPHTTMTTMEILFVVAFEVEAAEPNSQYERK
jgi:hypothetical protein